MSKLKNNQKFLPFPEVPVIGRILFLRFTLSSKRAVFTQIYLCNPSLREQQATPLRKPGDVSYHNIVIPYPPIHPNKKPPLFQSFLKRRGGIEELLHKSSGERKNFFAKSFSSPPWFSFKHQPTRFAAMRLRSRFRMTPMATAMTPMISVSTDGITIMRPPAMKMRRSQIFRLPKK